MHLRSRRTRALTLLVVLQAGILGCEKEEISVAKGTEKGAYGREQVLAAVEAFAKSDRSPASYRIMAATIETLETQFDDRVRLEAERHLVMLAITPLEANFQKPPDERLRVLGTSVWPTALKQVPQPGEQPSAYAERICGGALALECQQVVPEFRALQLSALVWARLKERARTLLQECNECNAQPHYRDVLDRYTRHERKLSTEAATAADMGRPSRWPLAGERALPWSNAPLLELSDNGAHIFEGVAIEPGDWTPVLTAARHDHEVLGVFIKSSGRVSDLRAVLAEANKAGFEQIALQVRVRQYPYPMAEYRLATTAGEQTVKIRDIDTIQVLVQALDAVAIAGQQRHRI